MSYNAYKNTLIAVDYAESRSVAIMGVVDHWGVSSVVIKLSDGLFRYKVDHPVFGALNEQLSAHQVRQLAYEGQLVVTASAAPNFIFREEEAQ
jgi:hypothetical protein